jgi:hypothetical protein
MGRARILVAVALGLIVMLGLAGAVSARTPAVHTPPAMRNSPLTLTRGPNASHVAHIMPTVKTRRALCPATCSDPGPLNYHLGAPVMVTTTTYVIFWAPSTRQSGGATSIPTNYRTWAQKMVNDIGGHGIYNIATQYYQFGGALTGSWVHNISIPGGSYADTSAYPASGCTDAGVPVVSDCLTDAQLQAEVSKVMGIKGWTGGLNHLFLLFTSSDEGSCFTVASSSCAYTQYCAYHSYIPGSTPVIYTNEPYGKPSTCLSGAETVPTGQGQDQTIVAALSPASHEFQEAVTDPLLNAWFTTQGNENGDLCAYTYGTNTWDSGTANEFWNGNYYEVQQEYSNHTTNCLQVGP